MPIFLLGIVLGGLSGGLTYAGTTDGQLAAIVGAVAAVFTWLGCAALIIAGD